MQRLNMAAGRIFTEDEVAENRAVGVLSPEVVDKFFNGDPASAVGASIDMEVGGRFATVQVVGTFERESASPLVYSPEEALVYVPYTLQERLSADPVQGFSYLQVRAASQDGTDQLASDVRAWAERAYADDPDFVAQVLDTKSEIDQVNQTMAMMSLVISAIGGISLLVGGIGVMNIMLVSVTERTREIGVRMALGATRKAVRMQFVTEAMMICLLGGVIGVLLGTAVGIAGTSAMGMMVFPPLSAVVIALVFSLAIGLFFGWYPANRAARMNPIEALRYE
ncbi:FtsX-like permease family protein [Corynebacterium aquatimens]|nr:ABC transporter permease [Corynebacterium aquatimens]QYH20263.1 FtsX-like permease family protein [Corynebacterium aquatimens]